MTHSSQPPGTKAAPLTEREALLRDLRLRQENAVAMRKAIDETQPRQLPLGTLAWRSFLALGLLSLGHFLLLASTDPVNFRHGTSILIRGAWQILVTLAVWLVGFWAYRRAQPATQTRMQQAFLLAGVAVLCWIVLRAVGLSDRGARQVWMSPYFLLTLGAQVAALVFLVRSRKRLRASIDEYEDQRAWSRPRMYLCEAAIFYLGLGIVLQALLRFDVFAMVAASLADLGSGFLFIFPALAYVGMRKFLEL